MRSLVRPLKPFPLQEPPGLNRASRRLDEIDQAAAETRRTERMRQSCSEMADLIAFAKQGEFREASDDA